MSKKAEQKANDEKLAALSQVNPFEYGYKPGSGVTIPAELLMAFLEMMQVVVRNESKEFVEMVSFEMGTQPNEEQTPIVRVMVSPVGKRAEELFNSLMEVHFQNIDSGLAVNRNQPQFDFGDEVKTEQPNEVDPK